MNYKFLWPWKLRIEYFGGLLFNSESGKVYNLSQEYAIFLLALKNGFNYNDAIKLTNKYLKSNIENLDLSSFIQNKVIKERKTARASIHDFIKTLDEINILKDKHCLSSPIEVSIYPTSKCQLGCKFCYFQSKRNNFLKELKYKDWKCLIKQLHENNVIYLSILGGEPTLYEKINKILKYVEKLKFKTTITTNALNIRKSTFKIIARSKFITPTISLQSLDPNLNERLTGNNCSDVCKAVETFMTYGKVPRINTVCTVQTEKEIYNLIDYLERIGIKEFGLNTYMENKNYKVSHSFEEYKDFNEKINRYIKNRHYSINYSMQGCLLYSAYQNLNNPVHNEFDKFQYGCEAGKTKIEILPNGDVYPCVAFSNEDFEYSNITKDYISDIWRNAKYLENLRKLKNKDSECVICKFYNFCNGGCPARNLKNENSLENKGDNKCQILINKATSTI